MDNNAQEKKKPNISAIIVGGIIMMVGFVMIGVGICLTDAVLDAIGIGLPVVGATIAKAA